MEIAEILKKAGYTDLPVVHRPQNPDHQGEFEKDFEVSSYNSDNSAGIPLSEYLDNFDAGDESQRVLIVDEDEGDNFFNFEEDEGNEDDDEEEEKVQPNFGGNNRPNIFGVARQIENSVSKASVQSPSFHIPSE